MNIIYFWAEQDNYMYQWQRIHIFDELERSGNAIEVFNPLNYESVGQANDCLVKYIKNSKIDYNLFMSCEGSNILFKDSVEIIKSYGLPTVLICFDNLHAPFMHKKNAPAFDLVWLTSKETIGMYKQWGCNNTIFQTYAANPFQFMPHWDESDSFVSFIGTPYGSRVNKLNVLTDSGVLCKVYADSLIFDENIEIQVEKLAFRKIVKQTINALSFNIGRKVFYGAFKNKYSSNKQLILNRNEFLIASPSVSFLEMNKIYSNSSLSLNITELRNTYVLKNPIHKIHLRTFEIPMSGGLEIASYTEELASYFKEDEEIVLYKSEEELISKAKFYLDFKNDSLTSQMKKNARKRAELQHTWTNRFENIFNRIF